MTTIHREPSEQSEPESVKKNIAVVHPLRQIDQRRDSTDNGVATTTVSFKDLLLVDLLSDDSPLVVRISQMLNRRNNRVIRNWKHLAQAVGVPADVSISFDCDSEHSPTEDLFDYLITWNPEMTIKDLKAMLRNAGRNDLFQILQKENYEDVFKVSDNMEIVYLFKDKLDTPKRHMDWRALASKCKIPRKTFEKFGKPKLGPTEHLFLHVRISKLFDNLTVEKLKTYLKEMDRFDVLKAIERHKIPDNAFIEDVFKSQTPILVELSELLDKDGPMKNWKNLAYRMGIAEPTFEDFDTSKGTNRNPTDLLLQWIFANRPDFTVEMMVKGLQSIERNDVVVELINEIKQAFNEGRLQIPHAEEKMDSVIKHTSDSLNASSENSAGIKLSQNLDHLTKQERCALHVTSLPSALYTRLCNILDKIDGFFRDYRMFAEELGMDKTNINKLEQSKSPTHSILLEYKLNVENFLKIVKSIDREDVAQEVEAWIEESPSSS